MQSFQKYIYYLAALLVGMLVTYLGIRWLAPSNSPPPNPTAVKTSPPQPPQPPSNELGTNPLELFQMPSVQQELTMTQEQVRQLQQLKPPSPPDGNPPAPPPGNGERNQPPEQSPEEIHQQLEQALNTEQLERFKQITFQVYGWSLIPEPELVKLFALDDAQQERLQTLKQSTSIQPEQISNDNQQECSQKLSQQFQKVKAANEQINQEMLKLLSEQQQNNIQQLQEQAFQLESEDMESLCLRS
ncbi:MAG: hypothetical protein AB4041_09545 [Microcystaceae cyanobacterium]